MTGLLAEGVARTNAWLASRSPRERILLVLGAGLVLAIAVLSAALAVRDDLSALRARVTGRERELDQVRRLAAALRLEEPRAEAEAVDGASLLARLEAVAGEIVGRDRIAGMTPASAPLDDEVQEERVTLRLADASLAEVVHVLHGLETGVPPLHVARLALQKHPDDATRFGATVEVALLRPRVVVP